jgi:CubicO group peptidase (beta-lactamase class C family)
MRKKIGIISILIIGLFFVVFFNFSCQSESRSKKEAISTIEKNVQGAIQNNTLVGLSIAVARNGQLLYAKGFGLSDKQRKIPVTQQTMFAIGSITKQFTSACIFLLAQENKLALSDPVAKYYPNLTRAADISLLDLMNHVSGYHDYYPLDFVDRRMSEVTTVDKVIENYAGQQLDFEPGTRYSYSNTGYLILGRVVEKVTGTPFGEFLKKRIFEPLGMNHTIFEPDPFGPGIAKGHMSFLLSPPEQVPLEAAGWVHAAGAIFSTPLDLIKWNNALFSGSVVNDENLKIMTSPRSLVDGKVSNYGCGLAIGERNGVKFFSHNGAVNGFYAMNWYVPSTKSSLVVLSNVSDYAAVNSIFFKLVDKFLIKSQKISEKEKPKKPEPSRPVWTSALRPLISDPPLATQVVNFFYSLQKGEVDRSLLGEEFNWFLTDEKIKEASVRLRALGEPQALKIENISERGGMEVSSTRLDFSAGSVRVLMYRTPDGKIQQYFVQRY